MGHVRSASVNLKAAIDNTSPKNGPTLYREGPLSHDFISHFKRKAITLDDPFLPGPGSGFLGNLRICFASRIFHFSHRNRSYPRDRITGAGVSG